MLSLPLLSSHCFAVAPSPPPLQQQTHKLGSQITPCNILFRICLCKSSSIRLNPLCVCSLIGAHCFLRCNTLCSVMTLSWWFDHCEAECKQSTLNAEWERCCWPPICIDSRWQMAPGRFARKRPLNTMGYSWHCYRNRLGARQINISQLHAHTLTHTDTDSDKHTHTQEQTLNAMTT